MYVSNGKTELGQFASNHGYSDLIAAACQSPSLKMFFAAASADGKDVVEHVCTELRALKAPKDVKSTADGLADMIDGEDLVFITNGTHDGDDKNKAFGDDGYSGDDNNDIPEESEDADADKFEIRGSVVKLAGDKHLVFGWFSIVSIGDKVIEDTQGDMITPETIESACYDFVLNARKGGEMHESSNDGEVRGVGQLVESVVFTREKQQAMVASLHAQGITDAVISLGCVAWWGGMYIHDNDTWDKVTSGELRAWSIGGKGKRAQV
jgi:hypothetical protein